MDQLVVGVEPDKAWKENLTHRDLKRQRSE